MHRTASIVAKVEYEFLCTLFLQVNEGTADILGTILGKTIVVDISYLILQHTIIRKVWHLNRASSHLHLHLLARAWTFDFDDETCTRFTSKVITNIRHILAHHGSISNGQDYITFLQSSLSSRHILVRFIYHHLLQLVVVSNEGTHACILSCQHSLEFLLFRLRIISGVRIQAPQHCLDAIAYHLIGIQRINVHQVEVLIDGIEDIHILSHLEIMVIILLSDCWQSHQHHQHRNQHLLHVHLIIYYITFYG